MGKKMILLFILGIANFSAAKRDFFFFLKKM